MFNGEPWSATSEWWFLGNGVPNGTPADGGHEEDEEDMTGSEDGDAGPIPVHRGTVPAWGAVR